ncbi:MAG: uracil-DNA glycosylase [Candidatus Shapirobacteria bacterium]|jgi:DNA polymerase
MPASNLQKLQYLNKLISECTKCPLIKTATNHVPGSGNPEAEIMIIGEAPGFFEDQKGLPFVGNSGKLLDKLLLSIKLLRSEVFIANILKHRPPENRPPLPEEIKVCTPYLKAQIQIIKPKIIITLGRFAMNYFFPLESISRVRGQVKKIKWQGLDLTIIPVYHPSAGLRNGAMLEALQTDFKSIGKFLGKTN